MQELEYILAIFVTAVALAAAACEVHTARRLLLEMRAAGDIDDDAFHALENDLDWMEVSDPLRAANADATQ